jgi:H+/Cl- antiporter ClcA
MESAGGTSEETTSPGPPAAPDPAQIVKTNEWAALLVLGALIGVPVAAVAYGFLKLVTDAQKFLFTTFPEDLGWGSAPVWWPVPVLALGGLLTALAITYLPGTAGHKPAEGFKAAGPVMPRDLPGVFFAALATLCFGFVLGPEAPLIAIGSGLGVIAVRLIKRDAPMQATVVIAVAGSFGAVSALLGSPLVGAFLLMEASGLAGAMMSAVLLPGFLAAGVGGLVFVGLNSWTGWGTLSLAVPDIPPFSSPTFAEFLWAIAIGLMAPVLGSGIRRLALKLQPIVEHRRVALMPLIGVVVAGLAIAFGQATDKAASEVLFSGQDSLPGLIQDAATWSVGSLLLLVLLKSLAYSLSLSAFRGGPVFPGMFIGAAGGMALSHLPGLPMIAGVAIGIAAMTTAMLGLPFTAVLLTALFLSADGLQLMPLAIVAAVVSFAVSVRIAPVVPPDEPEHAVPQAAPA